MNIALLLAGQGTKITEQNKALWLGNEAARAVIETAEKVLGEPIRDWFTEDLSKDTRKAQLATYVASICMYELYKQHVGLYPSHVLGHSLGELTALTIAGAFDYETGLKLVNIRGTAMKEAIDGQESTGMMALFASPDKVEALLQGETDVFAANYNSRKQTVIAGNKDAIQAFAKKHGLEGIVLGVSGAFHTSYMQGASNEVLEQLAGFSFNPHFNTEVISNKHAGPYRSESIREEIASQIISPVQWQQSVDYAVSQGVQLFVDLSPSGMFVKMLGDLKTVYAFHNEESIALLCKELKDDIEVSRHYSLFARALGIIVSTRNNSQDAEAYENIVVSGYNQIKSQIGKEETPEAVAHTLQLLELILRTKEVPEEEIQFYRNKLAWKVS